MTAANGTTSQVDPGQLQEQRTKVRRHFGFFTPSCCVGGFSASENVAGCFQLCSDISRSKQAVVSDFDETVWQHVLDEAPQELLDRKRDALATLGAKGDAAFVHADQSMITDTGAMCVLAQVAQDPLIDICSQHEHQSLTQVPYHIELLDGFAGAESVLQTYSEHYAEYKRLLAERQRNTEQSRSASERMEYLRFQIDVLERLAPVPGEFERLKAQVTLMRDSQRWAEFVRDAEDSLYEGEDSVAVRLGRLLDRARRGVADSPKLAQLVDQLVTAQAACEDALDSVKRFASDFDAEPGALERAEERLHELTHVRRKHGMEPDELVGRLQTMKEELQ